RNGNTTNENQRVGNPYQYLKSKQKKNLREKSKQKYCIIIPREAFAAKRIEQTLSAAA
ncbi:hypothetical protein L195_g063323, partial [Trifolium pratense]